LSAEEAQAAKMLGMTDAEYKTQVKGAKDE
jgi:phage I-like protein